MPTAHRLGPTFHCRSPTAASVEDVSRPAEVAYRRVVHLLRVIGHFRNLARRSGVGPVPPSGRSLLSLLVDQAPLARWADQPDDQGRPSAEGFDGLVDSRLQ